MGYLEAIQSALTSLAIVIAAIWAYFQYIKGRRHKPRVELEVKGRLLRSEKGMFLCASVAVENVGFSNIELDHEGSGLMISLYPMSYPSRREFFGIRPKLLGAVPIFTNHAGLEPNERVADEWMLSVPSTAAGFRLDARLTSGRKSRFFRNRRSWMSSAIVDNYVDTLSHASG